jgi:hypothetical protein
MFVLFALPLKVFNGHGWTTPTAILFVVLLSSRGGTIITLILDHYQLVTIFLGLERDRGIESLLQ